MLGVVELWEYNERYNRDDTVYSSKHSIWKVDARIPTGSYK